MMVQWLGLQALTAKSMDLIPGQVTKILQGQWHSQKNKVRARQLTTGEKRIQAGMLVLDLLFETILASRCIFFGNDPLKGEVINREK